MRNLPIVVVAFALGIAVAFPLYKSLADHEAGATYTGAHDDGGSVTVQLTGNGAAVSSFHATNVPLDFLNGCPGQTINVDFTNIPINKFVHFFDRDELVDGVTIDVLGDFDIPGFSTGFISVEKGECSNIVEYAAAVDNGPASLFGDINCDGVVNVLDALALMQFEVNGPVNQKQPCSVIGN